MRILILEDEPDLASALQRALREEGFACDVARDGRSGLHELESWEYDLVVLDLMLPELDGRTVLRRLRERKRTPVLVLTARDSTEDKVALLDAGADDYLTKPFQLDELLARVRALVRRSANEPSPSIELDELRIDLVAREVRRKGRKVALSPKEYALLEYLALHRGSLVSRTTLYEHLYERDEDTASNVLDVYVAGLRRKLGRDLVRTRRGEGYVLDG
jgi:two-component system, OmpR family, response regulator